MTEGLVIPFTGEGSGSGRLSWGQQTIWRAFETAGKPIWLTGLRAMPEGFTIEDLADELAFVMSRNQSLRTRLIVREGHPITQVVYDSGQIKLQVLDLDDDADPLAVAKAIEEDWLEHDVEYDLANDWPVRMILIRHRGVPAYRVRAFSHIVADGFGVLAMQADLAARDPGTGSPGGPITAMEPLEQAQWQASPAGRRRSTIAEQHWERLLRTIPAQRVPEPTDKPEDRYWRVIFDSRAAYLAVQAIAARTAVDTSPVLLAAYAVGVTKATGIVPAVPRVYVNNRFRPRLANTVSPIAQTCPCVIDVTGITFDEAVKRTYYASVAAYKNGYFEPVKIRELLAAISEERGEQIDVNCVYNDIRLDTPRDVKNTPTGPAEIQAALPLSTLRWEYKEIPEDVFNLLVQDSPDTINMMMLVDSHYIARSQVETVLREIEAIVVRAAFDPDVPTGL